MPLVGGVAVISAAIGSFAWFSGGLLKQRNFDADLKSDACRIAQPTDLAVTRVRSQPQRDAQIQTTLPRGTQVVYLEEKDAFVKILMKNGTTGWVFNNQIADCKTPVATPTPATTPSIAPIKPTLKPKPRVERTPTIAPTPTSTPSVTPNPSESPTEIPVPTPGATATPPPTDTPAPTMTYPPRSRPTPTPTPTLSPSPSPPTPTLTPTPTPTPVPTPTASPPPTSKPANGDNTPLF